MKNIKSIVAMALAVLAFGACQKENEGTLILEAEGMNATSKLAVSGNVSYWENGDVVNINGNNYTVSLDGSGLATAGTTEAPVGDAPFCGVYPSTDYMGCTVSGDSYTLTIPASYTYNTTTHGGTVKQKLQPPMLAYASSGNRLQFMHATAAITVEIANNFGIDISVTSITVESNLYQISGVRTFDITNINHAATDADTVLATSDAQKKVTMNCSGNLTIASGEKAQVQIPVLPVGKRNRFTIKVVVANADDATMTYTFEKTQGNSSSYGYDLYRAQLGYAPAKFGGVFSVSSTQKVIFAPGNLQHVGDNWQFATHQYDYFGNANQYDTPTMHRDMFAAPDNTNAYTCPMGWVLPKQDYWYYILNDRTVTNTLSSGARFTIANVAGVNGMIIFPDNYTHPAGATVGGTPAYNEGSNYTATVDADSWAKMEVAGCVFLPAAGINRSDGDWAWTDAGFYRCYQGVSETDNGTTICFGSGMNLDDHNQGSWMYFVRLVKVLD